MAKVRIDPIAPRATTSRRTDHVLRDTRWGPVVQKWPRPRGAAKSGYNWLREQEFKIAAQWASDPNPLEYETAINQVKGTEMVPRDLLMSASYGLAYQITLPDGTPLEAYRMVNPDAQAVLDQVTDDVGAMLYRAEIGWIAIAPGVNNQALLNLAGVPTWTTIPGGVQNPSLDWKLLDQSGVPTNNPTTWTWSVNTLTVPVTGLALYHEIQALFTGVTTASNANRAFQFSSNNGASYHGTSGDYVNTALTGASTNVANFGLIQPTTTAACDGSIHVAAWNQPTPKPIDRQNGDVGGRFTLSVACNALRLMNTGGINITGGKLYVWGR